MIEPASRRRRWILILLIAPICCLAAEAALPTAWQPTARLGIGAIRVYQGTLAPCNPNVCRFQPTCSHYGIGAIEKRGTLVGGLQAAWRIARCAPWGPPPGSIDLP